MTKDFSQITELAFKALNENRLADADRLASEALSDNSELVEAILIRGFVAGSRGNHCASEKYFRRASEVDGKNYICFFNLANALSEQNRDYEALHNYQLALKLNEGDVDVWLGYGKSLVKLSRHQDAIETFKRVIQIDQTSVDGFGNLASCYARIGEFRKALELYNYALQINTNIPSLWKDRGVVLENLKLYEESLASYDYALKASPSDAILFRLRGAILQKLDRDSEALSSYEQSLNIDSSNAETWNNIGFLKNKRKDFQTALIYFEKAIKLQPNLFHAWNNYGNSLRELDRLGDAISKYRKVIELKPDYGLAWNNLGNTLSDAGDYAEALLCYEKAVELNPGGDFWLGHLIHSQMRVCDWTNFEARLSALEKRIPNLERVSYPFNVLGLLDSPKLQRFSAEVYAGSLLITGNSRRAFSRISRGKLIRVGYFSSDFREHPVSRLILDLLKLHDRARFEVIGVSFGVNTGDSLRESVEEAVDRFFDVKSLSDEQIVELSRELKIDIAIDLNGHTANSRANIFQMRVAPIQISYLGYPGTWGDCCIDYLIGDQVVICEKNRKFFTEQIIFLPHQFQINPIHRVENPLHKAKKSYGLPEDGVIFACFNNSWKITPSVFSCWMRILLSVPRSTLWLYADNEVAKKNLRGEAERQGISAERLVFAEKVVYSDYLARYKHVDLFLDTLPYNAGTTASDSLWMGVPVLTQIGQSFAGRMAASLLSQIGLNELITYDLGQYEKTAIDLAYNSQRLELMKKSLLRLRSSSTIFDAQRSTKYIERAFEIAFDRYHSELPPSDIYLE